MAEQGCERVGQLSQQNLSNLAWAAGKLTFFNARLLDSIADHATSTIQASPSPAI